MSGMTPMITGVRMTAHTSTQWGGVPRMARNLIHQTVGDYLVPKLKCLGLSLLFSISVGGTQARKRCLVKERQKPVRTRASSV